jgi:hypothetical protein
MPRRSRTSEAASSSSRSRTTIPPSTTSSPRSGKPGGWDYDAVRELAARLHFKPGVPGDLLGQHDPGGRHRAVRHGLPTASRRRPSARGSSTSRQATPRCASASSCGSTRSASRRLLNSPRPGRAPRRPEGQHELHPRRGACRALEDRRLRRVRRPGPGAPERRPGRRHHRRRRRPGLRRGERRAPAPAGGRAGGPGLAMVFPQGSPLRPAAIDKGLGSMRADGSLAKISAAGFHPRSARSPQAVMTAGMIGPDGQLTSGNAGRLARAPWWLLVLGLAARSSPGGR